MYPHHTPHMTDLCMYASTLRRIDLKAAAHPARCRCFIPSVSAGRGAVSRPARGGSCIPSTACTWSSTWSGIPVSSRGRPRGCLPAVGGWSSLHAVPVCYLSLFPAPAGGAVRILVVRKAVRMLVWVTCLSTLCHDLLRNSSPV